MIEKTRAWVYEDYGSPLEVLELKTLDLLPPEEGEVWLEMLASPIHPSDFGLISGRYGRKQALPAVGGREGLGRIIRLGASVKGFSIGDRVRFPESSGVWRERACVSADELLKVPAEMDTLQGAMAFVNPPSAFRLLHDFVQLSPGDWIIQNAANSALGYSVIGFAKSLGIKTINVVRDAHWLSALKDLGADAVLLESDLKPDAIKAICVDAKPRLGLNSVGGQSVSSIIKCMGEGGTVVTFGGMTGEAIRFPTRELIFMDVCLRGFWMDRYLREHDSAATSPMWDDVFAAIVKGDVSQPVAKVYPFAELKEAIDHAQQSKREGKILIAQED